MDNVFPLRDRRWLEELFDAHYRDLVAYATRRVGPDGADAIAAEVFAVAWRRRAEVSPEPVTWLYAVARDVVLHEQRSHARRSRLRDALTLLREPVERPTEWWRSRPSSPSSTPPTPRCCASPSRNT